MADRPALDLGEIKNTLKTIEASLPVHMIGVREYSEGLFPVELTRSESGRLVVRARNECGNNLTDVDLWDLLDWLRYGPKEGAAASNGSDPASDGDDTR